jgi:hypothetical protein
LEVTLMQTYGPLGYLTLGWVFFVTLLIVLLSVEGGYRLGRRRRAASHQQEKESPVGAMVGATLGLLAFLLAFTFGFAASRFDTKRQVLLDEANAVGTTWLRAGLIAEPRRSEVRELLREYVDVRLEGIQLGKIEEAVQRSEQLQARLWRHAAALGTEHPDSIVIGLFIQSLNEVIDLHAKRVMVGMRSQIPAVIWIVLYAVAFLALASMGYHSGLSGTSRSVAVVAVAAAFSCVIWLIADLDRSQDGLLRVSQQSLIDARNSMTEARP